MAPQTNHSVKTLSTVLEKIGDNVMITDQGGVIEYVNSAFEKTTGYSKKEIIGQNPRVLSSGRHSVTYYQALWKTILAGQVFRATTINRKKDGSFYYADQTISPVIDDLGDIICFVSIWKDVTQQVEGEEKCEFEKKKLEQVLGLEAGLHHILDLNKLVDFVVEKTCEALQAQKCSIMFTDQSSGELCLKGHIGVEDSVIDRNPLKMGDSLASLIKYHSSSRASENIPGHLESHLIDGTIYQSKTFLSVPIELKDHLLGIINVSDKKESGGEGFTDMDLKILCMIVRQVKIAIENAQLYRELKFLTLIDPLTGIYNYRFFTQTLDYEIVRCRRYRRHLSFLMIDIDQLKWYNDTYGHLEGDRLLKTVAKTIKSNVRQADVVCRYAGDEFAVILPETDLSQARIIAQKIQEKIGDLKMRCPMSVSIGVTQGSPESNRYDLICRADGQLYSAKHHGKNQIAG